MLVRKVQNRLGSIDARATTKGDNQIGVHLLDNSNASVYQLLAGIGLYIRVGLIVRTCRQMLSHLGYSARRLQKAVGNHKDIVVGQALKMRDRLRPKKELGSKLETLHGCILSLY